MLLFSCFTKIQPMQNVSTNVHVPSAVALQVWLHVQLQLVFCSNSMMCYVLTHRGAKAMQST